MRILVLAEVFPPKEGGAGRWLWELYRRLADIDVAVMAAPAAGHVEFDRAAGLRIDRFDRTFRSWGVLHPAGLVDYLRACRRVRRRLRREPVDAVHCGKCLPEGLIASWTGARFWCFAHGEELTLATTSRELRFLTARVLSRAQQVIANSEHTRRILAEHWPRAAGKVIVLTPGVDTSRFVPVPESSDVRAQLGWKGRRVILTVGALQRRKGQDMLIRALPAIRRRCPDVLYAMAGEGWERDRLEEMVSDLGLLDAVQFLGVQSDDALLGCYQQCDLFALPNRRVGWDFEGFGIVLLEAQACGRAVVTGASGGTVETIRPGETGEIVNCDGPDELARVCADLLDDEDRRRRLGAAGRAWVVERFDWDVLTRRATEIFAGAIPGSA